MFDADRDASPSRWDLVRLVGGSVTQVCLLSERFFCLTTHWTTCTVPCCGQECPLCEMLPARGLFYLACLCGGRVCLVELGALSASHLEQHAKLLHGGMRAGLVVRLSRSGNKKPVRSEGIEFKEGIRSVSQLDLARHVMAIFKFPCPNPGEDLALYEFRCRSIAKVRCNRAAELLVAARDRQLKR